MPTSDGDLQGIDNVEIALQTTQIRSDSIPNHNNDREESQRPENYLEGIRLHSITAGLCMCLFLTNLEIPIVVTALTGITNDLGGFKHSSWIVAAYMLGYVGVLIIFSKLSDIFGRKSSLLVAIGIFVIFSAACGAAQTIQQLIVFRAFQGIGGAGNFALCTIIVLELVPPGKYAKYTSVISMVYSISLLLGPILGGAISQSSSWRWVFLLNVPAAVLAGVLIIVCVPNHFPHHGKSGNSRSNFKRAFSKATLQRVDFLGAFMLLIATLFFVAALEEAGNDYPWRSTFVITLLTISGIFWIAFLFWERRVTLKNKLQEPVFPWRFVQSRIWIGMLLNALFLGGPWIVAVFQLPQRLQLINKISPLGAGIRFIPFTLAAPVGSVIASIIAKAGKVPPLYLLMFAAAVQIVGFALLATLPVSQSIAVAQYGYEFIAGFGCGISIALLPLMTPFSVEARDLAVAMGAIAQLRMMGGVIGLAIVTTAFNGLVKSRLGRFLSTEQINDLLEFANSSLSYPADTQDRFRIIFAEGYSLQMKIMTGFAAAQLLSTLFIWQSKQVRV